MIALLKLFALAFVLSGLHWHDEAGRWVRRFYWTAGFAAAALGLAYLAVLITVRTQTDSEWDFLNYWLVGRIAAEGLPLYEAASYLRQSLPFLPSEQFFAEVMLVGTLYTPPAVLLFLPLGYFEYREAYILWSIIQAGVLVLAAVLMKREFFSAGSGRQHIAAWLVAVCLVAFYPPVRWTFYNAQVNFIMALLFMLVWRSRFKALAGVWIGVGMCIKPYFGILILWLLLRRRIGTVVLVVLTVALAFASAALVFGANDVATYFLDNPIAKAPAHLFTQDVNQSALAVLRRATGAEQWSGSPLMHSPYIAFAFLLTSMTAWSVLRCDDDRWALVACVSLGLLLAPQSLHHYSAVLLPAITFIALYRGFKWLGMIAIVSLFAVGSNEGAAFWLNLSVWMITASYPWWGKAFADARAVTQITSAAELGTQPTSKTVSKSGPGATNPVKAQV